MEKRVPALDGLRGLAILLVVVFHAWPNALPGGVYGVTLFFVLSGFLITNILTRELDTRSKIDFKRFYKRRGARLLPALLLVSASYLVLGGPWADVWPALAYVANFQKLAGASLGNMSPTWSLAIEEHFYLLWPLILSLIPRRLRKGIVSSLLVVSVAWRLWLLAGDATWERVYYGTDTMAFAILAGCWLAVAKPKLRSNLAVTGVILASLTVGSRTRGEAMVSLWVMFAVVGLCVVAINAALEGRHRLLELGPLRWLGTISYGLYLWHTVVLGAGGVLGAPRVLSVTIAVILAWLMFRSLERPILDLVRGSNRLDSGSVSAVPPAR